ncbi:MAG: hypothetical protein HBSAPP04_17980 [Ignavibacteriaceae bacterium]|nr:MAG: hypothetical protein HBSAPP04_17980 [Ignavibacteriaceae bacterium]
MTEKRKFLIARIDRIGDTVLATPIPRELKRSFPGCEVSVLVRSYTRDIFTGNPFVDNILVWDDFGRGLKKIMDLGHFLRYYRFTDIFMLLPNETLAYASVIGGIKRKFGTSRKLYHLLTGTKTLTRGDDASVKSEAAWCLEFVKAAGGSLVDDATEIHLTDEEKNTVSEIRKSLAPKGERIIGVHVTSGGSAPNMPPEEYLKLIEQLTEKAGVKVVVTDNKLPDEFTLPKTIPMPNKEKPLREAICNFAALDILISSSTGTMHIAAALKVETLSLFCPLPACTPSLWGPVGNKASYILPEPGYCQNRCPGDPKKCDFSGPGGIDVKKVLSML